MFDITNKIVRNSCAIFLLVLCSTGRIFGQAPPIPQKAYKNDLLNRLKTLGNYNVARQLAASDAGLRSADIGDNINETQYRSFLQKIRLSYRDGLVKKINSPANKLYYEVINPWQDIATDMINVNGQKKAAGIDIKNIINGSRYAAFWVCNLDNKTQALSLGMSAASSTSLISFYDAQFVLCKNYKNTPDALIPVGSSINIAPGEVKVFFVTIKGRKSGSENNSIQVRSSLGNTAIPLSIRNYPVTVTAGNVGLNAINWAYYYYPFFKGKEKAATANLKDHYINTVVIPINNLPVFAMGKPLASKSFDLYIDEFKQYPNIILGLDLGRQSKEKDYMSPAWKKSFIAWYSTIVSRFKNKGVAENRLYLYVADEPKPAELPVLTDFIKWVRSAIPTARLYATLNDKSCTDRLLPLLDVGQLYNRSLLSLDVKQNNMNKVWIYDTKNKAFAPYQSFRLTAWEAFLKGYGGIGFWNYADIARGAGAENSAWNDFDGAYEDYNVVYDINGGIINSRRWEAFKAGIEDYYILKTYASKYGMAAARQFCSDVLKNPKDINRADQVRNSLLAKLGGN
ncbi:glycoside hydrolase domain-containing protein [Chitinophaga sp. GCM10012297]|uniref:Glycoside hydrolase 123 catalytic domain-containing protein n=1 Tax=Chitinophaga chungangae TaxID=2821488 RepID=A0ABS3YF43_9BACT|nr:glycoside hydrolase domain-containing protein [Chitinophaga chungangae]MBO9153274.1 hypothetical protein [Chitinophaga chungangae]